MFVSLAFLGVALPLYANQVWVQYSTEHFDLYGSPDSPNAVQTLQSLERAHAFFERAAGAALGDDRVKVVAFASAAEYASYRINPGAYAFYQHSQKGDYIVLQELDRTRPEVALHEYVHFVMHKAGYHLPLWLNEGLADVYSTLQADGTETVVGRVSPGRLGTLERERRLRISAVLAVDHESPYYNQPHMMQLFYAESWALVHMLMVDRAYSPQFNSFLTRISEGQTPLRCFRDVYGKELLQVEADLDEYLSRRSLPVVYYGVDLSSVDPAVRTAAIRQERVDACLADLLASNPSAARADEKLDGFSASHPGSPEFEESLGYLAMRKGRMQDALTHFSRAVELNSTDPLAVYYCARLKRDAGVPDNQVIGLLQRVLELDPNDDNARLDLGFTAAKINQFELALNTLSSLKSIQPKLEYEVVYTMAYCEAKLNRFAEAQKLGMQARSVARNADQQRQANNLLRYVDETPALIANEGTQSQNRGTP
jgi:tetratricopeptide (TPR) repeat protein